MNVIFSPIRPGRRTELARLGVTAAFLGLIVSCNPLPRQPALPATTNSQGGNELAVRPALPSRPLGGSVPDSADLAAAILAEHNAERARRRLPPVAPNDRLDEAAQAHAEDMARRGKMAHRGSDGSSPFERITRAGYSYTAAAENVAYGFDRVDEVMAGWMHSPGHRRNILGPYREIGVGHAAGATGSSFWCVTFGAGAGR